jgi:uncharacterized membrane protein
MTTAGKTIILIGLGVVLLGVIVYFFGDKLSWFGKLPGDIRIEKENSKFYFPVTSMVLVSVLLNLIIWLVKKYF